MKRRAGSMRKHAGLTLLAALLTTPAVAGWELGVRGGVDSNVTRAVDDRTSAGFLWAAVGYNRDLSGESRLDWTFGATLDGAAYTRESDFDYAALTVSPGLSYVPYAGWTIAVAPSLQGKVANDGDQSALAWGVRVVVQQQLGADFTLSEHYAYTDSRAEEDVFSFKEHAVGVTAGYNWTPKLATEIGYQYSHGDSFRTLSSQEDSAATTAGRRAAAGPMSGGGMGSGSGGGMTGSGSGMSGSGSSRGLQAFGGTVVKDTVSTHQVSATVGYAWTSAFSNTLGYTYSVSDGDDGTSRTHLAYLGASYRF